MKRIFAILSLISVMFLISACEGDQGPPGEDGAIFLATTFEIDNVDFISNNGTDAFVNITIPNNVEVFESDVPLVFIIDPIATADAGVDVWEPLPRTFFFSDGYAQFRYNFVFDAGTGIFDVELILESDDFNSLDSSFTDNQIFRIVIVPSDFASRKATEDLLKVDAIATALKFDIKDIPTLSLD